MKGILLLIILCIFALFTFSRCAYKHTSVPSVSGEIKAHWIKKGESAPFSGILLSKEAYGKLRLKIILLEEQLHQCQENR